MTANIDRQNLIVSGHSPEKVTILDGGMGHLLRRLGVQIEGKVGTVERFLGVALANVQNPECVVSAHEQYINAGKASTPGHV